MYAIRSYYVKMNKLLLITCNPKSVVDSRGRQVANEFITHYRKNNPQDEITEINLFDHDIPRRFFQRQTGRHYLAKQMCRGTIA